jgi:hypothetical protein
LTVDLATQQVEEVSGARHVGDLHVAVLVLAVELVLGGENTGLLVTELEITLHTAGGVLRTLSIVTMGKGQNQARALQPLRLARGDKLVNDALSVIGEVTELGFPHYEGVGGSQRVTVFKSEAVNGSVAVL